ncbi:MAG: hypothetical protein M3177_07050 [Pseudomonadota bacterium]|nr:hypothetical protein [Pseudomonadota bacterium]
MNIGCVVTGHSPRPGQVYNSGYFFTECRGCGRDLIRTARSEWHTVPAGHRIVWGPGPRSHSVEADYTGVLPIVQEEPAALPALRSPFVSWSRALTRVSGAARADQGTARATAAEELSGDYQYPRLLLMAVILGAGLRVLLNLAAGR